MRNVAVRYGKADYSPHLLLFAVRNANTNTDRANKEDRVDPWTAVISRIGIGGRRFVGPGARRPGCLVAAAARYVTVSSISPSSFLYRNSTSASFSNRRTKISQSSFKKHQSWKRLPSLVWPWLGTGGMHLTVATKNRGGAAPAGASAAGLDTGW